MTKTYAAARRLYRAGEFPSLNLRIEDSGGYAWIIDKDGRALECFASRAAARHHMEVECAKASKWIGR